MQIGSLPGEFYVKLPTAPRGRKCWDSGSLTGSCQPSFDFVTAASLNIATSRRDSEPLSTRAFGGKQLGFGFQELCSQDAAFNRTHHLFTKLGEWALPSEVGSGGGSTCVDTLHPHPERVFMDKPW